MSIYIYRSIFYCGFHDGSLQFLTWRGEWMDDQPGGLGSFVSITPKRQREIFRILWRYCTVEGHIPLPSGND